MFEKRLGFLKVSREEFNMVSSKIDIDKYFTVRIEGFMPQETPTIGVAYVSFYVRIDRIKNDRIVHTNILCIGIGDGHNTLYISGVVDSEDIMKHREIMATSNLNGFKFGIYFIFDDGKGNKKVYLFDQPFDPATLEELAKERNYQEAIDYFNTRFEGKCSKLAWERDEKGLKTFYFVYNVEGEAKELEFKEENGKITILGFKQQGGGK
jgi:hypothetical protein